MSEKLFANFDRASFLASASADQLAIFKVFKFTPKFVAFVDARVKVHFEGVDAKRVFGDDINVLI